MANRAVHVIIQLVIFYLVISWLVRLARRRRNAQPPPAGTTSRKTQPAATPATPASRTKTPLHRGGIERSQVMFNGMLWDVTRRPHRNLSPGGRSHGYDTYVDQPPRCPKCGLGIVETKSWLGYTWSCPECGLRSRSSRSAEAVADALARGIR
ncbi:hypothetical protein JXD38_01505 [candidate division WOR-3 bacterium]|nr:hypothetical protein [candidate division WOR-3 bacterium]